MSIITERQLIGHYLIFNASEPLPSRHPKARAHTYMHRNERTHAHAQSGAHRWQATDVGLVKNSDLP